MNPVQTVEDVCPEYFEQAEPDEQWQYSYSPNGERESKRQIATAAFSSPNPHAVLSNCYYLLGQGNEQLAVYYGYTNKKGCHPLHNDESVCCESEAETAYYYLGEYNIYAPGGVPITFKVDGDGNFQTNYKIQDYLGNVRAVINQDKQITGMYDYMPFGEQVPVSLTGIKDRLSFIGKENDVESGLGDFGVRKYDGAAGRFLSIDPMWEKYLAWSPYHYCGNNPVNAKDPSGLANFYVYDSDNKTGSVLSNGDDKGFYVVKQMAFNGANGDWKEIRNSSIRLPNQETRESILENNFPRPGIDGTGSEGGGVGDLENYSFGGIQTEKIFGKKYTGRAEKAIAAGQDAFSCLFPTSKSIYFVHDHPYSTIGGDPDPNPSNADREFGNIRDYRYGILVSRKYNTSVDQVTIFRSFKEDDIIMPVSVFKQTKD